MQLKPLARSLAVALSIVAIAGCSSTGGTQDGDSYGSQDGSSMGAGTSGAGTGGQYGSTTGSGTGAGQQADSRIPEVRTIYFDYDRDTIKSEYESAVMAHVRYLRANPSAQVVLQGHTDERGTREYNMALGERRARAVQRFMNIQGVSPSQMTVVSYGEERPAVSGHNENAYGQNRRVVFNY
ncbi:18K peptidoglycan-associated outer membrane lipoprotein; Peptidoglycan-associated lipoprotein precursor; Outer membrane protein P6; OmpA/MotB precursor [Halomonas citrativorans]|uniref:Peptidoglycan-associated lipoprotein n=1 Tax=Halomonas citrativorans TaxID=2742612 RepID=A0A1R4HNU1_9GAMM|nr:peptidoglycan-associated lipoprotein Pal [Halomonas citrativorans]MBE0402987.1 peptidoglycan-associated lipoprotein Pal [Halomonas citrativorans]SJN09198.1 18K peptidoglycan-associated outer membrane lipoprotein; Peptidoglycan-associated lipoprotein precursor; Outer membrane protein P6; OmpA/MotB precursor [Halomonas citrativorans]